MGIKDCIFVLKKCVYVGVEKFKLGKFIFALTKGHKYLNLGDKEKALEFLNNSSFDSNGCCYTDNDITKEKDVHIIMPAYNVEKYIERAVESVLKLNMKYTFKLTVINDGSKDCTGEILKKYADNENVEIIYQENKGFSGARNTGLKHICGKYIAFLDSDDQMGDLESLLDKAFKEDADIVEGSYKYVDDDGKCLNIHLKKDGKAVPTKDLFGTPWGKVIKSEFFKNLCFPEGYWFEDSIMAQIVYRLVEKAHTIPDTVYYYRRNTSGITHTMLKNNKAIDSFYIMVKLFFDRKKFNLYVNQDYYEYMLRMCKLSYCRVLYLNKKIRKAVFICMANFINENFDGFSTQIPAMKKLEQALKSGDFGYFSAMCKWNV